MTIKILQTKYFVINNIFSRSVQFCSTMPFFSNKFSPKKVPSRKCDISVISKELGSEFASRELGLEIPNIKISLAENQLLFDDGRWVLESGSSYKENLKLRKSLKTLEEENNMLKLKFEILLDILTQTTAECQIQIKEINQLKAIVQNNNLNKINKSKSIKPN